MTDANNETTMVCHSEETSLKNYLFNGYLLREGYDIASANLSNFTLVKFYIYIFFMLKLIN